MEILEVKPAICNGNHKHPVHFNRGKDRHVWMCLTCARQLRGPKLPEDEAQALIQFAQLFNETRKGLPAKAATAREEQREKDMKLEIAVLAGAESKQFLVDLTKQIDRLEKLNGLGNKKAPAAAMTDEDEDTSAAAEEDDEDFAPKKKTAKKAAAAAFDDEEEDAPAETESEDEDDDFTTPAKKAPAKKAKKLTIDDVNDACKARAAATGGKEGRAEVLALLKKHFKTQSVSDVKPEDYEKLVKIMKA